MNAGRMSQSGHPPRPPSHGSHQRTTPIASMTAAKPAATDGGRAPAMGSAATATSTRRSRMHGELRLVDVSGNTIVASRPDPTRTDGPTPRRTDQHRSGGPAGSRGEVLVL